MITKLNRPNSRFELYTRPKPASVMEQDRADHRSLIGANRQ